MPTDPTLPAPAPLTVGDEAIIRGFASAMPPTRPLPVLLAAYDATRAELARERAELAEVNAFRAEPLKAIRNLIGEEDQDDEALLGSACAIILSWKGLAANKKKAEAGRDAARAAHEALLYQYKACHAEKDDADAAGRALVAALECFDHCEPNRIGQHELGCPVGNALAHIPTRWRTGEEPE